MLLFLLLLTALLIIVCCIQWKKNFEKGLNYNKAARRDAEFFRYCSLILMGIWSVGTAFALQVNIASVVSLALASFGSAVVCGILVAAIKASQKLAMNFVKVKAFSWWQVAFSLLEILGIVLLAAICVIAFRHFIPLKEGIEKLFK
jgi:hypothetical protein